MQDAESYWWLKCFKLVWQEGKKSLSKIYKKELKRILVVTLVSIGGSIHTDVNWQRPTRNQVLLDHNFSLHYLVKIGFQTDFQIPLASRYNFLYQSRCRSVWKNHCTVTCTRISIAGFHRPAQNWLSQLSSSVSSSSSSSALRFRIFSIMHECSPVKSFFMIKI